MKVLVRDNDVNQALRALRKKMQQEGILKEVRERGHYETKAQKKRRKKDEAVRRHRKAARKRLLTEGF